MFYRLRILSLKTRILYTIVLEKFKPIFKAWSSKGKEGNNCWWWNCFHPKRVDGVYFQREGFVLLERQLYSLNFCAALLRFSERNFFFFFFLTAWDGITWEFFHDLRVLHGEICVGFFSSLFLLLLFFFSFLRNPPHRKKSQASDLDARTNLRFTFHAYFESATFASH